MQADGTHIFELLPIMFAIRQTGWLSDDTYIIIHNTESEKQGAHKEPHIILYTIHTMKRSERGQASNQSKS